MEYSVGIEIITSEDRKEWTSIGTIWAPGEDVWTNNYTLTTDGNIWAPDCHYINGEFWVRAIIWDNKGDLAHWSS